MAPFFSRNMSKAFIRTLATLTLASTICLVQGRDECDKFFLSIEKEPEYFVPRSAYVVGIESNNVDTFSTFSLTAEAVGENGGFGQTGWFSLMFDDEETQFSSDEINTIEQKSTAPKQSIHVLWTAPSSPKPNCVLFKANVNYQLRRRGCRQRLEKKFCPLSEENVATEPNDECCACDEASYSLIFQGLWSNGTHPNYFPNALQLTHYSDFIGCSHSRNITMWSEGQYATEGLRQIAEFGSRSIMESELLEKVNTDLNSKMLTFVYWVYQIGLKKHLRSLIKMPGLWYPRMNLNTSTTFRVDKQHNLISLAAMLGPSPDWFTGISNLNLCTKDCSWIEDKVLDVGLYDAGTDSGVSYMSPNAPTAPQERIFRITSRYPEDPRAPFYSMEGEEMKPIGRLYLHRNQITQKSCFADPMFESDHSDETEKDKPECATTNYTDWSPCSASCGKGLSIKTRKYLNSAEAESHNCSRQLMQKKICMAEFSCPGESIDDDALLMSDENCKTSEWSEWSECTATCGIGFMTRSRRFFKSSGYKKCKHVSIFENKKCMEPPCKATSVEQENTNCTTSPWSEWSPCTATCGKGLRIRIRHLIVDRELREFCQKKIKLEERRECNRTADCIVNETEAKEVCQLSPITGPCRALFRRWYFNVDTKQCTEFNYGGCRGNRNNFLSWDECVKTCSALFP